MKKLLRGMMIALSIFGAFFVLACGGTAEPSEPSGPSDPAPPAHTHTLSGVSANAASCGIAGNTAYWTCSGCGKYFSDAAGEHEVAQNSWVIVPLVHSGTHTPAADPEGDEPGNTEYWTCAHCGRYFSDSACTTEITAGSWVVISHDHEVTLTAANPATCTASGNSAYYTCSVCGKHFSDEAATAPIEAGSWVIEATGHSVTCIEASDATCLYEGNSAYYMCGGCGKYYSDSAAAHEIEENSWVLPTLRHSISKVEATEEGCDRPGNIEYYACSSCGKGFADGAGAEELEDESWVIAPHAHTTTLTPYKAATCEEDGNINYYTCSECSGLFYDMAGTRTVAAADTVLHATGHRIVIDEAVKAVCLEDGNTEGSHCTGCNTVFKQSQVLPALGHNFVGGVCTRCGEETAVEGLQFTQSGSAYTLTGLGSFAGTEVVVPATYNDLPVTAIAANAFKDKTNLTRISVPDSVKSIASGAFSGCSGLTSLKLPFVGGSSARSYAASDALFGYIFGTASYSGGRAAAQRYSPTSSAYTYYIPASLTDVEITGGRLFYGAFFDCTGLTHITLGNAIMGVDGNAFFGCSGLTEITLAGGINCLTGEPFTKCTALTAITAREDCKYYSINNGDVYALNGKKLVYHIPAAGETSYTIPAGVLTVGSYSVSSAALTELTIPAGVKTIESRAFYECTALTAINYNAEDCADFSSYSSANTFYNAGKSGSGITVTIGAGVKHIPAYLFYNFSNFGAKMTRLVFASAECTVGAGAFSKCAALEGIDLGSGIVSVGTDAFEGCIGLKRVDISNIAAWCAISFASSYANPGNLAGGIYVGGEQLTSLVLPASVTEIKQYAFFNFTTLTQITLSAVSDIGNYAFSQTAITELTLPDSVVTVGNSAFASCRALERAALGNGVATLGNSVFYNCAALTELTVGRGLESIGTDSFNYCAAIQQVHVAAISSWCGIRFANLAANPLHKGARLIVDGAPVTVVTVPTSITAISPYAFYGCADIVRVVIPASVTSIGEYAFYRTGIKSINIPDSVKTVGNYAFYGCASAESITVGRGVKSIGAYTFEGCLSVTSIAYNAADCAPLARTNRVFYLGNVEVGGATLTVGANVKSIPNYMFDPYDNQSALVLTSVTFASGSVCETIGDYAFAYSAAGSVVLPATVTEIGAYAFYNCKQLESISLPAALTALGSNAFYIDRLQELHIADLEGWCNVALGNSGSVPVAKNVYLAGSLLTELTIPTSVTEIKDYSFYGMGSINKLVLHDGVTKIGISAFGNCTALNAVTIPSSVTSIGASAFSTTGLTAVTIPDTVTTLCGNAFENCTLLASVTLGSGVTSLPANLFSGCKALASVVIPDSVTSVGNNAFLNCIALKSVTIGIKVKTLGTAAFSGCVALESVVLNATLSAFANNNNVFLNAGIEGNGITLTVGASVASLPANMFFPSSSAQADTRPKLVRVVFEQGSACTTIGQKAFYNVATLAEVHIPAAITRIDSDAFSGCSALLSVHIADIAAWCAVAFGNNYACPFIYGASLYVNGTLTTELVIPASVTAISSYAFYGSGIESLVIGSGLTDVGSYAFMSCKSLKSVTIGNNVTAIGDYAFYSCTMLTSVDLGSGVQTIGRFAFGSTALLTITLPASLRSIGNSAFSGCYKLFEVYNNSTYLTLSCGSTNNGEIAYYAKDIYSGDNINAESKFIDVNDFMFYDMNGTIYLVGYMGDESELVLPEQVRGSGYKINERAFYGDRSITSVTIPQNVTEIGNYAFSDCRNLVEINYNATNCSITASNNNIFNSAGASADGITVNVGANVAKLPANLFYPNTSLGYAPKITRVVFAEDGSVEIGNYAFYGCAALVYVDMANSVTKIGNYAFNSCSALESISVPDTVTSMGSRVFTSCSSLKTVYIGSGVTDIESSTFYGCNAIESMDLPFVGVNIAATRTSALFGAIFGSGYAGGISASQYYNGTTTTTYTIPAALTTVNVRGGRIAYGAFSECTGITTITLGPAVTGIENYAFYRCLNLSTLNYGIAAGANLAAGNYAFTRAGASSGGMTVNIAANVTAIPAYLFYPDSSVASDPASAPKLSVVNFADGSACTAIGDYAFAYCSTLLTMTLPEQMNSIAAHAFTGCFKLMEVCNRSQLTVTAGSEDNGYVAHYAKNVYTATSGESRLTVRDGYIFYKEQTGSVLIGYTGSDTVLVLPADIDGASYSIAGHAFESNTRITSVTVPSGITTIGEAAFFKCTGLTEVVLPDTVTQICEDMFRGCTRLAAVTLPDTVTVIAAHAFDGCTALTSIALPASLKTIGDYAFNGCTRLATVTFNAELTSIGERAFNGCTALAAVNMGNKVTEVGNYAFYNDTAVAELTLSTALTTVGRNAFYGLRAVTELTLPASLSSVGEYAFARLGITSLAFNAQIQTAGSGMFEACTSLAEVTIGGNVAFLPSGLFSGCTALRTIVIPDSVTQIGSSAFSGCTAVTTLTIGKGVQTIGGSAFSSLTSLTEINYNAIDCADFESSNYTFDRAGTNGDGIALTVGAQVRAIPAYMLYQSNSASRPKLTSVVFAGTAVERIGGSAFRNISTLTELTLPAGIKTIGENAFSGCNIPEVNVASADAWCSIDFANEYANPAAHAGAIKVNGTPVTAVVYPAGATKVGGYAFYGFRGLTSVTLSATVAEIGDRAFYGCTGLTTVTMPAGLKRVGNYAFYNCQALGEISLPAGLENIGYYAFYGCLAIEELVVPDSVTGFGSSAVTNCTALERLVIGSGVTSLDNEMLSGCNSLVELTIPFAGTKKIASSADANTLFGAIFGTRSATGTTRVTQYYSSSSTKNFYIPDTLKRVTVLGGELKYGAFYGCASLTSVTLGSGVTAIGENAFYGCTGLDSVTIGSGVTSIDSYAFSGCTGLTEITLGGGEVAIGSYAFSGCTGLASVTIGSGVTSIGDRAFNGCTAITEITFDAANCANLNDSRSAFYNAGTAGGGIALTVGAHATHVPNYLFYSSYGTPKLVSLDIVSGACTSVGAYAFSGCSELATVTGCDSVTHVGERAFYGTAYFNDNANMENGILYLGKVAILSDSVSGNITLRTDTKSIADSVFEGKTALTGVALPSSLVEIGKRAFYNSGITAMTVPDSVTTIGESAFGNCASLEQLTIGDGVTRLPAGLLSGCGALQSLSIPFVGMSGSAKTASDATVLGVLFGSSSYTGGRSVRQYYGTGSVSYYIPDSLTTLTVAGGELLHGALNSCSRLTAVTLGSEVTGVGMSAFGSCTALTQVTVGSGVTHMDADAFSGCTHLAAVYISDISAWWSIDFAEGGNPLVAAGLLYLDSSLVTSAATPAGATTVKDYVFNGCTSLVSVTISAGVTSVGTGAFCGCTGLTAIALPSTARQIGANAFEGCTALQTATFGGVTEIGASAFEGCTALTAIAIPDAVTSLGNRAFAGCSQASSLAIGSGIAQIPQEVFMGCAGLTALTLPTTVTGIGTRSFKDCTGLVTVSIPATVSEVGMQAFEGCSSVTALSIANGVQKLNDSAFKGMTSLTELTVPQSVTSMGLGVLEGCTALQTLDIPFVGRQKSTSCWHSATEYSVFGYVFGWVNSQTAGDGGIMQYSYVVNPGYGSYTMYTNYKIPASIRNVTVRGGVVAVQAFYNCSMITNVTLCAGVTGIAEDAFRNCTGLTAINILAADGAPSTDSWDKYSWSSNSVWGTGQVNYTENDYGTVSASDMTVGNLTGAYHNYHFKRR